MAALWTADIRLAATSLLKINVLLIMVALMAAISLLLSSPPYWVYSVFICLSVSVAHLLSNRGGRIDVLVLPADGSFRVLCGGLWLEAELLPHAFVAPWLIMIRLRMVAGGMGYFCWLPNLADADVARQARVVLRWRSSSNKHRSDSQGK